MERDFDNDSIYYSFMKSGSITSEQFYGSKESELSLLTGKVESVSKWKHELIPKKINVNYFVKHIKNYT